jgi:hypothetical protein
VVGARVEPLDELQRVGVGVVHLRTGRGELQVKV